MSSSLSLRGLHLTYPGASEAAVAGVDLEVPASGCVALLGRSGSGKSSVLRLAAGLEHPDRGDVVLDGRSVLGLPPERRGLAMVSQRPQLFPHLSVVDNVAFALRIAGVPRKRARLRAEEHLELVQLPGYGSRAVHELSGGQAQRVALARALAAEPRVLLLDEAFSALDAELRQDMHALLHELRRVVRPTIVLVTHDPGEAGALADSVAVLHRGTVLQHAPLDDLYHRPTSLLVHRMLGGLNEVAGIVSGGMHRSELGAFTAPVDRPNGPAVLVVRQETVRLRRTDDVGAAVVTSVQPKGARALVTVRLADGVSLHAEVGPGHALSCGDLVDASVDPSFVSVLAPQDPEAGDSVARELSAQP